MIYDVEMLSMLVATTIESFDKKSLVAWKQQLYAVHFITPIISCNTMMMLSSCLFLVFLLSSFNASTVGRYWDENCCKVVISCCNATSWKCPSKSSD